MPLESVDQHSIRASSLTGYSDLVRRLGGDPDSLLRQVEIEPEALANPDNVLPLESVAGVVEESARQLECPDFGLRLSEQQDLMILGQLSIMALNAADFGHALELISQHLHYFAFGVSIELEREFESGRSRLVLRLKVRTINPRHVYEHSLGVANNSLKMLSGDMFQADSVLLAADSPLSQRRYWRTFHAPVLLNQAMNALVFDSRYLKQKIDRSNPQLRDQIAHHIGDATGPPPLSLVHRAEIAMRRLLPTQRCTLKNISQQMAMAQDELEANLREQFIDFEELLDRVRRQRADAYLGEAEIPLPQVACMLGFDGKEELAQACQRWFDQSPQQRRRFLSQDGA